MGVWRSVDFSSFNFGDVCIVPPNNNSYMKKLYHGLFRLILKNGYHQYFCSQVSTLNASQMIKPSRVLVLRSSSPINQSLRR
jgi:hypothetical protein